MNNEQVIKYVSENSKNPHAAMMVEQLLTGWDVELEDQPNSWVKDPNTIWHPLVKYRLVKPKMKPAYRVFRLAGETRPRVQYRNADGSESSTLLTNTTAVCLTDWVEYDPEPKQWPTPLVERIAAIDIEAAEWIVDNWDELLEDRYTRGGTYRRDSNTLGNMFFFGSPPQCSMYWADISIRLGE